MSGPYKPRAGPPIEGSTFSTTLHLLSPELQNWIRSSGDRGKQRRFACACVRALFGYCPQVPPAALQTVELAERACRNEATGEEMDAVYIALAPLVRDAHEQFRAVQNELEADEAGLDDVLARELGHRALVAARGCVLRSAAVAAAEAVFELNSVLARRKLHELHSLILNRAEEVLDRQLPWALEQEDDLLQSYFRDLPRPLAVRLQCAGDTALRLLACTCAEMAVAAGREQLATLKETGDFAPLQRIIAVGRRAAEGQAGADELREADDTGSALVRDWFRREDELRDRGPVGTALIQAAGLMARLADCVHACAELSARLAAIRSVRQALPLLGTVDASAVVDPLAKQFLGPQPAASENDLP